MRTERVQKVRTVVQTNGGNVHPIDQDGARSRFNDAEES